MGSTAPYLPNYGQPSTAVAIPNFGIGDKIWSAKPYWLQLDTLFTSTAGETPSNQSQVIDFPVIVRGATTELSLANRVQLSEPSRYVFSFTYVPFQSLIYRMNLVQQYNWWSFPYFLQARQPLFAQFINDAADPDGNIMFYCEKADTYRQHTLTKNSKPFELLVSWKWTGSVGETINATNQPNDADLLIFGASFNGVPSTNTVQVTDLSANYLWANTTFRFEYFFGLQAQTNPILRYPRPIFLPRNSKLNLAAKNNTGVNATQFVTFYCLTLDQGMTTTAS